MIILRDLPSDADLGALAKRYPDLDPDIMATFLAFIRTACEIFHASEEYFTRCGTSCGRFTVLALLNRHPGTGRTPSQIADACGVTRATITGLLDGLESDRLIRRERNRGDRRTLQVFLTDQGQRFLDRMLPEHFQRLTALMAGLSRSDRAALRKISNRIASNLPSLTPAHTARSR